MALDRLLARLADAATLAVPTLRRLALRPLPVLPVRVVTLPRERVIWRVMA
jgi:hypothetical protein